MSQPIMPASGASTLIPSFMRSPMPAIRALTRTLLVLVVLLCAGASPAAAQVVVNGGTPNGNAGWNIFDDNRAASAFSIGKPTSFDAIRFWGILFQSTSYSPDMFWQILRDDGGSPGASVALEGNALASATLRSELAASSGAFSWQFDLATGAQTLGNGNYWLALHDGPLDPNGFTGSSLLWETTDAPGAYDIQTFTIDDSWVPGDQVGLAFELRAASVVATPEPGSIGLLAGGLLFVNGVAAGVRRRKRRWNPN